VKRATCGCLWSTGRRCGVFGVSCLASGDPVFCLVKEPMALFVWGVYKYVLAGSGLTLLAFKHTWHPYEPKQTPPTHLLHRLFIFVRLGVIPSAFAWVSASSGTWESIWLCFSYCSWWLPPPKRVGAAEEHRHKLVIVHGHLPTIVRGLCLPRRSAKGNISGLLISLSYLTCG